MLTGSKTPLIWPLLDKLKPQFARQQRPKSLQPMGVFRLPTTPWDAAARPRGSSFGQVEGVPTLWDLAYWNIGLAAINLQPIRLRNLFTNPRAPAVSEQRREPGVVHSLLLPVRVATLSGVTYDSNGVILPSCTVDLFDTATDIRLDTKVSDATTGAFSFTSAGFSPATHYLVAYLAGSPDVAGTTINTLTGTG